VLEAQEIVRIGTAVNPAAVVLDHVSFSLRRGEILGLAGLVGAGRTELVRAIFGADRRKSGRILLDGKPVDIRSPVDAIKHGIGLVPEDRKGQGLILGLAVRVNMTLAHLDTLTRAEFVQLGAERRLVNGVHPAFRDSHAGDGAARRQPERRQPAEGCHLKVVDAQPQNPDHGRTDARHRRRRQIRNLRADASTCGARHQHHHDFVGIPGTARHVRPHRLPGGRARDRRSDRAPRRRWKHSCITAPCVKQVVTTEGSVSL
jgi:ABC-type dipeptide/oligopeptide/nickel transport system ATPase subunit